MDVRRAKKSYPMTSMEMNAQLGGDVLDSCPNMKVDVHEPDVMIHVEVRDKIYLYSEVIPGPAGMRLEQMEKRCCYYPWIDSPVAGYCCKTWC